VICGNCGKPCTVVAEATSCCHYKRVFVSVNAASLEAQKAGAPAAPSSIDDLAAARERLRQARLAERQK
jgi:hypothetical protein